MPLTQVQNGMLAGVIPASLGGTGTTAGVTGFKNRIINGDMGIDQRNAGASFTPTSNAYTLDRWQANISQSSKFSVQQNAGSVTPPVGFSNYLGVTSTAATSVGAGDYFFLAQAIEGFNTADLGFGTANAKTVTLSFWVRSSLTGTFGGSLQNSAQNRNYPFSYTINSANTWEYETITIPGDVTGTWIGATNGIGLRVNFGLGVGSTWSGTAGAWNAGPSANWSTTGATSVVSTNGATWYVTGVQLEVGSAATNFDYLPYGTELQLCQRYFFNLPTSGGGSTWLMAFYNSRARFPIPIPVPMRSTPTMTLTGTAAGSIFTTVDDSSYVNLTYTGSASGSPSLSNTFVVIYGTVDTASSGAGVAYIQNNRTFSISAEF